MPVPIERRADRFAIGGRKRSVLGGPEAEPPVLNPIPIPGVLSMVRKVQAGFGLVLMLGSVMVLSAGCGSSGGVVPPQERAERVHQSSLAQVADLLFLRKEETGKPPAKAADLARYEKAYPLGYFTLKRGSVVLLLGAPIEDGVSDRILAYEKQTPESGGYVLMQDGRTIKKLTAEEFQGAPKVSSTGSSADPRRK
jgi:hypothetical protein